ncbi:anibiotic ABC transporter [Rhodococcus sp. NPDC047139]|uniref:ABC transporter permease n=1 Tax=Rhodococcus sp. NPDC047139 TaxID=3155141 RepID=UPI0033CB198A
MIGSFVGTGDLIRLAVRRDRVQLPVWLAAITVVYAVSVSSIEGLYPTQNDLHVLAVSSAVSPVVLATNGLVSGDTLGAVVTAQTLLFVALAAGLMSTLAVVRHTRQNEETGRAELVGANVVGRRAMLTAGLAVAVGANLVLVVLLAVVSVAYGLPPAGSLALGLAAGAAGISFAAVAAVTAQIAEGARAANGLAGAALGAAFLLRAIGDSAGTVDPSGVRVTSMWLSWLSPIGWAQQIRPFDVNAWWVLQLFALFVIVMIAVAYGLTERRDFGAGLVQPRPGPARAADRLPTAFGLAWRLQRTTLLWWAVGLVILAATYGSVADEMDNFLDEGGGVADLVEQLGGGAEALTDGYFAMTFLMMALFTSGYAVQSVLRLHSEETSGRVESVLTTGLGRVPWVLAHFAVVLIGVLILQFLVGLVVAVTYGAAIDDLTGPLADLLPAALVYVPAISFVAAAAVLCVGVIPGHGAAVAWGLFAVWVLIGQLGVVLDLPQFVLDLSPFTHVPSMPAERFLVMPLAVLSALAVVTAAAGVSAMRRRDLVLR